MVRWQKCVNTNLESIKHTERQSQRVTNKIRKEGLKIYADMTIYAIDPARLVPKMCHHNLPTIILTSLTLWYIILSSVAKMYAACSRSPHNVLHSLTCNTPLGLENITKEVTYYWFGIAVIGIATDGNPPVNNLMIPWAVIWSLSLLVQYFCRRCTYLRDPWSSISAAMDPNFCSTSDKSSRCASCFKNSTCGQ